MESFLEGLAHMNPLWIYTSLLIAAYLENIIPPIPGDSVVLFGAYLVGIGTIEFLPSLIVTTVGSLAGFMTYYAIGRYKGREFFKSRNYKWFDEKRIEKVDEWFKKWGTLIVIGNRFLAGTRSVVSIFAGFSKLGMFKVLTLALISSMVWNSILISAGYIAGKNWKYVESILRGYNIFITALVLTVIVISIYLYKKRKKSPQLSESS